MSSRCLRESISVIPISTRICEIQCSRDHRLRKSLASKELRKGAEDKLRVCSQSSGGAAVKSQGRQPLIDRGEPSPPSLPRSPGGATGVTVAPAGLCQGERGAGTVPGADAPGYSPPPPFGGSDTFRNRLSAFRRGIVQQGRKPPRPITPQIALQLRIAVAELDAEEFQVRHRDSPEVAVGPGQDRCSQPQGQLGCEPDDLRVTRPQERV